MLAWIAVAHAAAGEVAVVLRERGSGIPVEAAVEVEGRTLQADADGRVTFDHDAGVVALVIRSADHEPVTVELTVGPDGVQEEIWLRRVSWSEELTVYGEGETDAVERQVVSIEELRRVPGSFGDPVRALQSLPAVARPHSVEGALVVRGAEATSTGTYVDGVEVPFLFHLLAGKSVVSPSLVDRVDFYPGGMPTRYGDVAQAVVDARTADGPVQRGGLHGDAHVDLMETGAAVRVPLPGEFDLRLSGRASWLSSVVRAGQLAITAARGASDAHYRPGGLRVPYADFYGRLQHPLGAEGRVYATVFGADDGVRLVPERYDWDEDGEWDPLPVLPEGAVDRNNLLQNHFVRAVVGVEGGSTLEHRTMVAVGRDHQRNLVEGLGVFAGTPQDVDAHTQLAWLSHGDRLELSDHWTLTAGLDARVRDAELQALGVGADGEQEGPIVRDRQLWLGPHAGIEATAGPVWLSPGVRWSGHDLAGTFQDSVEPRLAGRLALGDRVSTHAFVGRFSDAPTADRYALDGAPALLVRADQVSGGIEVRTGGVWSVGADVYRTWFDDLVVVEDQAVLVPAEFGVSRTLGFEPVFTVTEGSAVGGELLVRRLPADGWFGWLAVSAGRSVRRTDGVDRPSDTDTPLDVTLVLARDLPHQFGLSGKLQAGVGQPYTPRFGVYVSSADLMAPVSGDLNGARLPPFFQLDLRVDKSFTTRGSRWTLYLDVYNATNYPNPLFVSYNWDYSERETRTWIPTLPSLGAEVSF